MSEVVEEMILKQTKMTNREAIEWQKAFKKTYEHTSAEALIACDMAIAVLEKAAEYEDLEEQDSRELRK